MYGKNPGGQKFWQRGEGIFRKILSCPPKMCVAPQMPPQIPRPGAATANKPPRLQAHQILMLTLTQIQI